MNTQTMNLAQLKSAVQQNSIRRLVLVSQAGTAKYYNMRIAANDNNIPIAEIASENIDWSVFISQKVACIVTKNVITEYGSLIKMFANAQYKKVAIIFHDIDQAQPEFLEFIKKTFTAVNGVYTMSVPDTALEIKAPEENIIVLAGISTGNIGAFVIPDQLREMFDVQVWCPHC